MSLRNILVVGMFISKKINESIIKIVIDLKFLIDKIWK